MFSATHLPKYVILNSSHARLGFDTGNLSIVAHLVCFYGFAKCLKHTHQKMSVGFDLMIALENSVSAFKSHSWHG